MRLASLSALLLAPTLLAAPEEEDDGGISPALDLLPEGSTLREVSIPRYDEQRRPTALLRAGLMTVETKEHVSGQNVELRLFESGGETRMKVHMGAADYRVKTGTVEATEVLTLSGNGFSARGKGALFHLESRSAFVFGPATTTFTQRPEEEPERPPEEKPNAMINSPHTWTALALVGLAGASLAEPPEALTPAEVAEFDQRSKPSAGVLASNAGTISRELIAKDQLAQTADLSLRTFANKVGRPELLTITTAAPAAGQPEEEKTDPALTTEITCDGGMFFDVDKAHVVYLKNVVVKKPDFTLHAGKELKIFLEKKEPVEGGEGEDGIGAFDDISTIVATGGVKVVRKDDKGQVMTATADTATYDAKSGDIVLRGGFPRVQQGRNYVRALEAGLYVRIYASGKGFFQEGRWETKLVDDRKDKKPE